jgi:hypothetical protein
MQPAANVSFTRTARGDRTDSIGFVVTIACGVVALYMFTIVFGSLLPLPIDVSIVTSPVCVTDTSLSGTTSDLDGAFGAYPEVAVIVDDPTFCIPNPSVAQRVISWPYAMVLDPGRVSWSAIIAGVLLVVVCRHVGETRMLPP